MIQPLPCLRSARRVFAGAIFFICANAAPLWGQGPAAIADFSLPDANPNSPRFESTVSPRDYLQQVSGWYFGHAT